MSPDYLATMRWSTKDDQQYYLKDMTRSHVRNSLQWCMRNNPSSESEQHIRTSWSAGNGVNWEDFEITKDGHTYDDWILAFTVRLLDPTCE